MDGPAGEDLLFRWADQGFMTRENILKRVDKEILDWKIINEDEDRQLQSFFTKYGIPFGHAGTLCLDQKQYIAGLENSVKPEKLPFLDVLRILFRSMTYLSSYPFPQSSSRITVEGHRRAFVLLLPDPETSERGRVDALIGAHNAGRARTKWDRRRLLFQSFAKSQPENGLPFNEQRWSETAAKRAGDYPYPCDDFTITNRTERGDEIFHDYVDLMEATQLMPAMGPRARIARDPFISLARVLHAKDHTPRLEDLAISHVDLYTLTRTMLRLHLDSSGQYFKDHEEELGATTDRVVAAFLYGRESVNWEMFASALDRTMPWLFDPLFRIASYIIYANPAEHREILPSQLGTVLTVPHLTQLSLFLHDDFDFESFKLVHTSTSQGQASDLPSLVEHLCSSHAQQYPGLLLFSAKAEGDGHPYVFGYWSENPAEDKAAIVSLRNLEYQVSSLFQLSPIHDVFPGRLGKSAWQAADGEIMFGDQRGGVSIRFRTEIHQVLVAHHVEEPELENGCGVFAATDWRGNWELELYPDCVEYWQYTVDE